jgi:hypothetical protein
MNSKEKAYYEYRQGIDTGNKVAGVIVVLAGSLIVGAILFNVIFG